MAILTYSYCAPLTRQPYKNTFHISSEILPFQNDFVPKLKNQCSNTEIFHLLFYEVVIDENVFTWILKLIEMYY